MNLNNSIRCSYLVIDNFYNNPHETREHILKQNFSVKGNYPGLRTKSYANKAIKDIIQKHIYPFAGKIIRFPLENTDDNYNGAFQYTTSRNRSWIHNDGWNNWAAVLYLTPDAPVSSGTGIFMYEDGTRYSTEVTNKNKALIGRDSQDLTKWTLVDRIGNIFNRLIIFNAKQYHSSLDYFGSTKEDSRLFQVFFFSTEK